MKHIFTQSLLAATVLSSTALAGSLETIEIPWSQTNRLGASCCSWSGLGSYGGGSYTNTQNCASVYGSCYQSKGAALWLFDLSDLPEDAIVSSASFKGVTEYSDMGGNTTFSVKPTGQALSTTLAYSVMNSPSWSSNTYMWGGNFSFSIPASQIEAARAEGGLAVFMYVSSTSGVNVMNSWPGGARLSVVVDINSPVGACCLSSGYCAQVPQNMCESGTDTTFHGAGSICAEGSTCPSDGCGGDVQGDGVVNVEDLLGVISRWGPCIACDEDLNADGAVDVLDLMTILDGWGQCD
jgi:hypothetical protein